MPDDIKVQIGNVFRVVEPGGNIPPIGTRIVIEQSLTDDGTTHEVEVTKHEWRLLPPAGPDDETSEAYLSVHVHTRSVR